MKKDVLLIAHFCSDFDGKGNNRFSYIADLLSQNECDIELVTTDFSHSKKARKNAIGNLFSYRVTMLHEPGYLKNVSLKRLYSHYILGRNLKKYLEVRKKPDVIYCAVPSLDVAKVAAGYAKKNNIRFIIDVQDLWPEAFKLVFNIPLLGDLFFLPMNIVADMIYRSADYVIAVSDTYLKRVMISNRELDNGSVIYLGTELKKVDKISKKMTRLTKHDDEIWMAYIGTLGSSYDLTLVFDALDSIEKNLIKNLKFIVMGDGPYYRKFFDHAKEKRLNVVFTGKLQYEEMISVLKNCDIAVNPIKAGSAASIINKVCDYSAVGLPVLNTQECLEYRTLVDTYGIGYNCKNGNVDDFKEKLTNLITHKELRIEMGKNSRRLAEDKFDREIFYNVIIEKVLEIKNKKTKG